MKKEIERKFLVKNKSFIKESIRSIEIKQGYIGVSDKGEARISIRDNKAWIVIKSTNQFTRLEYEVSIPKEDAEKLLIETCSKSIISKTRYIIPSKSDMLKWEIDVFHGDNEGLILAEIELPSEDIKFEKPDWIGKEVTENCFYYNNFLYRNPYKLFKHLFYKNETN